MIFKQFAMDLFEVLPPGNFISISKMADADEREENVDSMETGLLSHFLLSNVFVESSLINYVF
jgi:hypothetical protein